MKIRTIENRTKISVNNIIGEMDISVKGKKVSVSFKYEAFKFTLGLTADEAMKIGNALLDAAAGEDEKGGPPQPPKKGGGK